MVLGSALLWVAASAAPAAGSVAESVVSAAGSVVKWVTRSVLVARYIRTRRALRIRVVWTLRCM